ncbi:MAG TPA: hypothetical protein VFF06_01790, partial [Polyangia bacterium]|nr:hypothetical protein [Polyangia bacterium]
MRITLLLACTAAFAAGCYNPDTGEVGYYCHPMDDPACPDGTKCLPFVNMNATPPRMESRCQRPIAQAGYDMAGGLIPKTGVYTGTHQNAMLNLVTDCPDSSLEPNDSPDKALDAPLPTPDMPTAKITKMAICPVGPNPATGNHDVDYFRANTTSFTTASTLNLRADVFYDIVYGDLDVGIFDATGNLLASDGSAVSNACAVAVVPPGVY